MDTFRWRRVKSPVVSVLCVVTSCLGIGANDAPTAFAQSQLDGARSAVRTPDPLADSSSSYDNSDRDRHCHSCDEEENGWGEFFGPIIAFTITAPWWGPHAVLGDSLERPALSAPYPECWHGRRDDWSCDACLRRSRFGNIWLEYGNDYDNLERVAGAVRLETTSRWGLDGAWVSYQEVLPTGASDRLMTGDLNITFRFAQSDRIFLRTGLGVNWLDDTTDTDLGFNFTYGGDVFLHGPWVLSTEIDWGTLRHAERFHGRTTLGVVWRRIEAFGGFDYESFDAAALKSVVFGARYWY